MLERLEVLTAALEDVRRQRSAESHPQVHVLSAERRAVEGVPEPEERLHALEARIVALGVVLGLERDVARIEREEREARGVGKRGVVDGRLPVRRVLGIRELGERAAAEERAVRGRVRELGGEALEPFIGNVTRRRGRERAKGAKYHGTLRGAVGGVVRRNLLARSVLVERRQQRRSARAARSLRVAAAERRGCARGRAPARSRGGCLPTRRFAPCRW